jgi:adenylate cyclase
MDSEGRRLAAIVVADVVGYSRLMADDEDGTLAALRAHNNATDPLILNHGGRIVKTTGDGQLLEFPSAVAALSAGLEVQALMTERNAEIPESRRMELRIGINLGDVVVDVTGDIFGDGVNIAARVEAIADPGGISITNAVYDSVRGKLDVEFTDDGERELKNIPRPVRIWRVGPASSTPPPASIPARRTVATIAVLPFENMSGDSEQEYFADGLTEDLLTALSYERSLAVVARNSTFAYKGTATDIRVVARELDATHVVEGSVRKAGNRVRVTAQLIDAETGHHVWAERYDRDLDDIFELQDELVDTIAAKLRPSLWEAAGERRSSAEARSLDAWDLYLRGQHEYNRHTIDGFLKSTELFDRARELEPAFVAPIVGSGVAWLLLSIHGWRSDEIDPWERGAAATRAALTLDNMDYGALVLAAAMSTITGEPARGEQHARRAIEVNPQGFGGFHMLGANLNVAGRPEEAIDALTQAWRLGRHEPLRYDIANDLAWAQYMNYNYDAALTWGQTAVHISDIYLQTHLALAATYAQLDRVDEGRLHVAKILEIRPNFSVAQQRTRILYQMEAIKDHIVEGLVAAGLPK